MKYKKLLILLLIIILNINSVYASQIYPPTSSTDSLISDNDITTYSDTGVVCFGGAIYQYVDFSGYDLTSSNVDTSVYIQGNSDGAYYLWNSVTSAWDSMGVATVNSWTNVSGIAAQYKNPLKIRSYGVIYGAGCAWNRHIAELQASTTTASTLTSSGVSQLKIFPCGQSVITANFSGGVTSVTAIITNQQIMKQGVMVGQTTSIPMTDTGSGTWSGTFGNDQTLDWGTRTISFRATDGSGTTTYGSGSSIFVYNVGYNQIACGATPVSNYTQVGSGGFGNYTRMLYNGNFTLLGNSLERSFIGWALYPFIQYWGYLFYVLVIFSIVSTIYLKTQSVAQPLTIGIIFLLVLASTGFIDMSYRQWVIFIIALALSAIYYKVFVRD